MCSIQILFLLIPVVSCAVKNLGLTEGEACKLATGGDGTCLLLDKCPAAIEGINNHTKPLICGFDGKIPIVCCEITIAARKCIDYKTESKTTMPTTECPNSSKLTPPQWLQPPVIGGTDACPHEFPHMALLGHGTPDDIEWSCGGSLISKNFVLTAAHCIYSHNGNVSTVKLGVHKIPVRSEYTQTFTVKNIFRHPQYSPFQRYHDIALIELDHPASITNGVKPACLHDTEALPTNSFIATGWGVTVFKSYTTKILQKVNLQYVSFNDCEEYYKDLKPLKDGLKDEWQICADGGGNRSDTCYGDSGGPLQLPLAEDTLYTIIGVTSFAIKCTLVPSVYTRVSHYVPWIEGIVWPNN